MTAESKGAGTPYPLLFTTEDLVPGNGFLARVKICGRALAIREDDDWWFYGVEPGALAEGAPNPPEAFIRFRASIHNVLEDFASEAASYEAFEREARRFFDQLDIEEESRWTTAVEAFRAGIATPESPFDQLPKKTAEMQREIRIQRVDAPKSFASIETQQPGLSLLQAA